MSQKKKRRSGAQSPAASRTARPGAGRSRTATGAPRSGTGKEPRPAAVGPVRHPRPSVAQVRQDLESSGRQEGSPGMLVAALLGTTVFMFVYLHVLVLQQMTQLTGGLAMPDSLFAYDAGYLARLDAAMDDPAHGQLNWVHKTAGVIFPVAVGLSVAAVAAWSLPRGIGRWASYAAGLAFAVVDIVENVLIESALRAGGQGAGLASASTSARWVLLVAITLWVVLLVAGRIRRLVRERREATTGAVRRQRGPSA
ncbi:hypothetical protein [Citricoccus sp. SGAir0253]|uniref:hypothetical protein n=1 Tax=Citricoccus sp. SGAir0253 TaxID=2567881 RepID=UPI00143D5460|nr:hypothetical protein [Citricoccus sp. SGAir0253]